MAAGDRHSKRTAVLDRAKLAKLSVGAISDEKSSSAAPAPPPAEPASDACDATPDAVSACATVPSSISNHGTPAHDLDDEFSAWDENDVGARQHAPPLPARATTQIARKPITLVDPVSMRDIVLSRSTTLEDPMTTHALAERSREDEVEDSDLDMNTVREARRIFVLEDESLDPGLTVSRKRTTRRSFLPIKEEDLPRKK